MPQIITPIRDKSKIYGQIAGLYFVVYMVYMIFTYTAMFALKDLAAMYSINFAPPKCTYQADLMTTTTFFQYFIAMYPIAASGTNALIVAIILRNNLKLCVRGDKPMHWIIEVVVFPTVTLVTPFCVAMATKNVDAVVGGIGGFLSIAVQFILPVCFVLCGRKVVKQELGDVKNPMRSPLSSPIYCYIVLVFACLCELFVGYTYIHRLY